MSDDLRFRFKSKPKEPTTNNRGSQETSDSSSIFGIWDEQRRIQKEDERIAQELAETKKRAKELRRTLYKNKYGETKKTSLGFISEFRKKFKKRFKHAYEAISKKKKLYSYAVSLVAIIVLGVGLFTFLNDSEDKTATLGDSVSEELKIKDNTLPREKPDFSLLYPTGKSQDSYDVVRISPSESDPSFTYLDRFTENGAIFRVTQQEIPDSFKLEEAASGFQATDVIQVDDNKIFHGFSEQGGIQSLLFIKDDKLVLIRSPQKFSDDLWANYYLSLN